MKSVAMGGWTCLGWLLSAASVAAMPDAPSFVREVVAQRIDPASFDFERAGFWELDESARLYWSWSLISALSNPEGEGDAAALSPAVLDPTSSCEQDAQRRHSAYVWTLVAKNSDDAREWRTARAEVQRRLARMDEESKAKVVVDTANHGSRVFELHRRVAKDQVVHEALKGERWTVGLSRVAEYAWPEVVRGRMQDIVCDNTAWLKIQIEEYGWFDARKFGASADAAAWQVLLHSTRDVEFQRTTFRMLKQLPKEATSQAQLAHLDDRLAIWEGRPQRFGTVRFCFHDGSSKLRPELQDPGRVNDRRRAVGLEPIDPAPIAKDPNCPIPGY